jgi:molybdenum cofactor cytidylyltransferase
MGVELQLARAFRLPPAPRLALVGAGGKTTALFQLARQLPPPVLVTATTHLAIDQLDMADQCLLVRQPSDLAPLEIEKPAPVHLVIGPVRDDGRASGLEPEALQRLLALADKRHLPLLVEADGARRLPLKAPGDHEPALPQFVDTVVVVAGLSAVGKPLTTGWVHRPERFAELSGLKPGDEISPPSLTRVLLHPQGGLKGIPLGVRRLALLNQADTPALQSLAQGMATELLSAYAAVVVAALAPPDGSETAVFAVHERTAGIILAAGTGSRFGQLKQVLAWRGEPLVRHVARTALAAGLSPVVVVCGAGSDDVHSALAGLEVVFVENEDWPQGQSGSLRAGLSALPAPAGAAVFLLADQPHIPVTLVRALVERHAQDLAPVVAPLIDGRRGNPVLFDRATFPDLLALQGDTGGRALLSRYPVAWVPWHDPSLLLDVDRPEDYQKLLEL